jgi:hypothetical protein
MIIVYGTRSGASDTHLATPCSNCRQPALVQSDWYQYFHVMFIPTFPVGKQRTIHCGACDNSFEAKGSAPIWTFLGSMLFVVCLLGGAARQALRHFGAQASSASITSAASAPTASASAPATASAPTPKAATPPKATSHAAAAPSSSASAKSGAPAASAPAGKKKK